MTCERFPACLCPDCGRHRLNLGVSVDGEPEYGAHGEMYHMLMELHEQRSEIIHNCPFGPGLDPERN